MRRVVPLLSFTLLGGCVVADVAQTAVAVVKVPVKVVSASVDAATTSQSEADEKRGRELRKADEDRARDEREARNAAGEPQGD